MNTLKRYNRKYRLSLGIITALILGITLGVIECNRESIISMGASTYRIMGNAVQGTTWPMMMFMFAILHFAYYKMNEEVYDVDIICPVRNLHFEELGILAMVACIEINLIYWPYTLCHYGNIFQVIPLHMMIIMMIGFCMSSMIIVALMYVLTLAIKNPALMMGIGQLWTLLFAKTSIYSWEAPHHYIRTMQLLNPITQSYEYQRVLIYYYYLQENDYSRNTVTSFLPNYFTLLLGGIGVLIVLSEIAYYLKRRNMYAYIIDEGAY